jgi:hypothetical protein
MLPRSNVSLSGSVSESGSSTMVDSLTVNFFPRLPGGLPLRFGVLVRGGFGSLGGLGVRVAVPLPLPRRIIPLPRRIIPLLALTGDCEV